jgi:hypothetical protein
MYIFAKKLLYVCICQPCSFPRRMAPCCGRPNDFIVTQNLAEKNLVKTLEKMLLSVRYGYDKNSIQFMCISTFYNCYFLILCEYRQLKLILLHKYLPQPDLTVWPSG